MLLTVQNLSIFGTGRKGFKLPTTELKMQGINNQNAGRGGMYHYSNRRTQNNRFSTQNKDWRLSQMLNEWELQQEAKKKEEILKEKVKERKELTKN